MTDNMNLGKAGELRVAAELLMRGHECFLTLADSGVDIVLGSGLRLQVKSAHARMNPKRGERSRHYTFSFKRWKKRQGHYVPHPLEGVDFAVLWASDDDAFFIVPVDEIKGRYGVKLNLTENSRAGSVNTALKRYRDAWDLLEEGGD